MFLLTLNGLAAVLWSIRSLAWYKSIPAVLFSLMAWVLTVVNTPKEGTEAGSGGSGQQSGHERFSGREGGAGDGGSSSWWGGSGGKAKLKSEVPKGVTGDCLVPKGATGDCF